MKTIRNIVASCACPAARFTEDHRFIIYDPIAEEASGFKEPSGGGMRSSIESFAMRTLSLRSGFSRPFLTLMKFRYAR